MLRKRKIPGSNPTVDKHFLFCNSRSTHVHHSSSKPLQMNSTLKNNAPSQYPVLDKGSTENIYNGIIFPSLNPDKIFQFNSRWIESTKSSAVGPNHMREITTSNQVKCPLLWEFWICKFSRRILERVFDGRIVNIRNECLFLGSWGMNRSAEQTNRPRTASRFTRFVCPALRFIPHEPRKKTLIP